MNAHTVFPPLDIPETIAAGPGPGQTDTRVLARFAGAGLADHMQADVLRGMIECKHMLRTLWGTANTYTFGVAGTGFSGLDAMFSAVQPGDTVVAFVNGTFSGIDGQTLRMKAATAEELAADPLNPQATSVVTIDVPHGTSVTRDVIEAALTEHKPKWAFMAHWETGSGRINDIRALSDFCEATEAMGLVDAVSSLGVSDFAIDDYPGIVGWASCPQKGVACLPLTYAPVSFSDRYIDVLKATGARTYAHHPILEARHWAIIDGQDAEKGIYHRTHSGYAVAAFHEALRIALEVGVANRAAEYTRHEAILREAVTLMGCDVTSDMTSLLVLDLPTTFKGREMELVQACRAQGFGIWPTLSEPVQVRVGILNLLSERAITDIALRFGQALNDLGAHVDLTEIETLLSNRYSQALAA
ncbi:alanine--glyoxylate aminotransferase family protein [Tropicibacter sp. Alg240-R139]|uniref:alanine--glyoxylate aminotransferase family protein n=1 Tax=Tropicibacter sp. Alg240-R139 TaxID=2305991 RepID=UPI0013E034F3|nr:alanine--glyoxylate aminotransferase family protein [Tropicibacter sp. Alg240-R139]